MNSGERPLEEIEDWRGEAALISRPEIRCRGPGFAPRRRGLVVALAQSATLAEATEAALAAAPDFDLAFNLAALFSTGLVSQIFQASEG